MDINRSYCLQTTKDSRKTAIDLISCNNYVATYICCPYVVRYTCG